jgi:hypothetical protein
MATPDPITKAEVLEAIEAHVEALRALRNSVDRVVWAGPDGKHFMGLEAVVVALHGRGEPGDSSVIGALDGVAAAIREHGTEVSNAISAHAKEVKEAKIDLCDAVSKLTACIDRFRPN